ncbi:glyoxylase-like metal-dependent hydrolase (beta-lactamase superfamily II) [Bacilli bacterium PM5-9]|nr:glyoxylase-like metal-dependent hydrolase (beta-lactamase superfamily II) [Bacilli bacterium PM5-9]
MELIQVGEKTYYIKNATNIGIYKIDDENVYLIDSGNDKDAAKKILKIITENGWNLKGIISTHSNADHIGGNKFLQDKTECNVLAYNIEKCITEFPMLEPSFLYGGYPFKEIRNKFLMAKPSKAIPIEDNLPNGLEFFTLHGHFFDMVGIKTSDDVYFLADSLIDEKTIKKYHLFFVYDIKEFLKTLDYLETLKGALFIPSHCEASNDITSLIKLNRDKVMEVMNKIYNICENKLTFEEILKNIFEEYNLVMNANQFVLVGSTVKSYLAYLADEGKVGYEFNDNKMIWSQKNREII